MSIPKKLEDFHITEGIIPFIIKESKHAGTATSKNYKPVLDNTMTTTSMTS